MYEQLEKYQGSQDKFSLTLFILGNKKNLSWKLIKQLSRNQENLHGKTQ